MTMYQKRSHLIFMANSPSSFFFKKLFAFTGTYYHFCFINKTTDKCYRPGKGGTRCGNRPAL